MNIKHLPQQERPREKLIARGAQNLSDAELLAIFLRTGTRGKSAIDLARELLDTHLDLRTLLHVDLEQFCHIKGLGISKYCQLKAILEMNRRYLFEDIKEKIVLDNLGATQQYLITELSHFEKEAFGCLFLDTQYGVIDFEILFTGSINHMNIYPREIVKAALKHNASAIILVHNHPSGCLKPSQLDIKLTKKLRDLLFNMDVNVLDHIIVGKNKAASLSEQGYI